MLELSRPNSNLLSKSSSVNKSLVIDLTVTEAAMSNACVNVGYQAIEGYA